MADVQLENGYTRIANEILEAIMQTNFSPTQYKLIIAIFRFTYGYRRKEAEMSLSFLANATFCDKRHIQRELKELESYGIIHQRITKKNERYISFEKNYDSWTGKAHVAHLDNVHLDNAQTDNAQSTNNGIVHLDNANIVHSDNQKRNLKKAIKKYSSSEKNSDNPQAKKEMTFDRESAPYKLAAKLAEMIHLNNPDARQKLENDLQRWARDFDLMIRRDNRIPHDIYDVLYYAENDSFWKSNILSAAALRKQYDRLKIQMKERR